MSSQRPVTTGLADEVTLTSLSFRSSYPTSPRTQRSLSASVGPQRLQNSPESGAVLMMMPHLTPYRE
ncbi:unnamed protein product [Timema podura]|uniref:Uncharacterized protein n=1 Tax=Timema podura TaxID=61482 RepID=A0ABN7PQJ4_TIMPD|nr:unnamed protein product [Timema podura]